MRRLLFTALFLPIFAVSASCKKETPAPTPKVEVPAPETAVPAPDGLVLEGIVRSPDAILQSLRTISPLVPERAAPVLADMLHVSRETTEEIEGTKPAFVVLTHKGTEMNVVFAVPVKDANKVLAALAKQGLSRTEDPSQALSIFEAGPASAGPKNQVLGVRRGFLLAASNVNALKELAPFATRTMPTRAVPKDDISLTIPASAMKGPVREGLKAALDAGALRRKEMLAKAKAGGATAPKGTPISAIDAIGEYSARQNEKIVGWLESAGDAHVTLSTVAGALALKADCDVPDANSALGKQIASWPLGDAMGSLDVPANALVAFSGRSSEAGRTEASHDLAEMLATMWPDDIPAAEKTKVEAFLASWDKARGDTTSGALLYEGPARLAIATKLAAKDPAALAKLMKEALTSILGIKGVVAGLTKEGIGAPTFVADKIAGADVQVMSIKLPRKAGEKPQPGEPETADVVFGPVPGSSEVAMVAGVGSKELFATVIEAKGEKSLKSSAELEARVKALGSGLAGAAIVLPSRTVPLASGGPAAKALPPFDPVVLAIGKGEKGPWLSIDVAKPAMELAGRFLVSTMLMPKK
jgi:hypothetical protein